jgi:putative ABC transport system permease protein
VKLAERSRSFEAIAVVKQWLPTLADGDQPERLDGQQVSAGYFHTLGVSPALGRDFGVSDDVPNGPKVVILSDGLWRRRFGGDSAILGRQSETGRRQLYRHRDHAARFRQRTVALGGSLVALAVQHGKCRFLREPAVGSPPANVGAAAGRRECGSSEERSGLDRAHFGGRNFPGRRFASLAHGLIVNSLQDEVTRSVKPALLAVFGAMILVLLIACVNVTNLLLARSAQRRGEFSPCVWRWAQDDRG